MQGYISWARPWMFVQPAAVAGTVEWRAHLAWSYPGGIIETDECQTSAYISWARPWMFVKPSANTNTSVWKAQLAWSIGCVAEEVATVPIHHCHYIVLQAESNLIVLPADSLLVTLVC